MNSPKRQRRIFPVLICVVAVIHNPLAGEDVSTRIDNQGVLPTGKDGRALNLDFEAGSLLHWRASGDAFEGQPVRGNMVQRRKPSDESGRNGLYWIGTYELQKDAPQGMLVSQPFEVTHPFASFLVGGGSHATTRVEVVLQTDDGETTIFRASGANREKMRRVVADLTAHVGEQIFVRLVDQHSGAWGHINFDDFKFHDQRPVISPENLLPEPDDFSHAGLAAKEAAAAMTVPEGFQVRAIASEPEVKQPIAFALDDRGRIFVAEAYEYPFKAPDGKGRDRILIFEDSDGDGSFETRKVFAENLNLISGLEVGFGGVWVGQAPHLLFIPDKNRDDRPDGPPEVLLDGWGFQDTHETLNAFIWGPDGWLYGCHGVFTHSRVGKPGTPDSERTGINAGIWRYHPTRHVFEVFAHGTSNPWGVDFNDHGHAVLTACVIPHLFHIIQGGRFRRQAGAHFNPYTYDDIKTIARHRHWIGRTPHSGNGRSDAAGGGHAHAGAMIYLGGTWPQKYHNQIFMNNVHGARINQDLLIPEGSGYVGDRAPDFLLANDSWSQILNMRYGPDGQMYMIDWYDMQQCHRRDAKVHDRSNGRIYKVSYGKDETDAVDLQSKSDHDLVQLQLHKNDWYVRHARRILQERTEQHGPSTQVHSALARLAFSHEDVSRRLRGLWALHVTGGLTAERARRALNNDSDVVRAWTVQLLMQEDESPSDFMETFAEMARYDSSQIVRLYLASALNRMPPSSRWDILQHLVQHPEDAGDHNLPLMYWYAAEPLAELDLQRAIQLASKSEVPLLIAFMARRIGEIGTPEALSQLVQWLGSEQKTDRQSALLDAVNRSLQGRRRVPMPENWPEVAAKLRESDDRFVVNQTDALALTFGDPKAMKEMRTMLSDQSAATVLRQNALAALLKARDQQLPSVLHSLIRDGALSGHAIRALAAYDDSRTPEVLLRSYPSFGASQRRDALATLASRRQFAERLLEAVAAGHVPPRDLPADVVRQIHNLGDAAISRRLAKFWGIVRDSPEEKARLIAQYKQGLARNPRTPVDVHLGRTIYQKTCAQCHKLFGTGGDVGPELTGSNRADMDYLLSNVIDPSAVMAKEYQPSVLITADGRTVTGLIKEETENALTVVTQNDSLVIPRDEIELVKPSDKSMMPDDLLKPLAPAEVRALVAYVQNSEQVPMRATQDNLKDFFNGTDLSGWTGNTDLWNVEDGMIVGTTTGLKKNEFLRSQMSLRDFKLTLQVQLVDNAGNSGIQFRSEELPNGSVKGYQADIGKGWWGKLYEEHGRRLLWDKSGEQHVKLGDWNKYEIIAVGSRIKTLINDNLCVDLDDPEGARQGIIAFQLHSGGPTVVRFKDLQLELDPDLE